MSLDIVSIFAAIGTLTLIGLIFGLILSVAHKKLKVEQDPRIDEITYVLSGANCGACGYPGCAAYAKALLEDNVDPSLCIVGGADVAVKIGKILGVNAEAKKPQVARIHCQGGDKNTIKKFIYSGPKSCAAANQINGGFIVCSFGCLGFGDCAQACPFGAISIDDNNLAVVDYDKCTGCGKCVESCPRGVISMMDRSCNYYVKCSNTEKALEMKKGCKVGCIGCRLCINKACLIEFENNNEVECAINMKDNYLAVIDHNVCTNCGKCLPVCPQKVIIKDNIDGSSVKKV